MKLLVLFLCLIYSLSGGYASVVSAPFRGNSEAYLQVHWILQRNEGGARNVSIRHSSFRDPQVMWRVNDVIISETSPDLVISNVQYRHGTTTVSVTSLLVPDSVVVNSLQLHLVMDVNELLISINLPDMDLHSTRVEYVPDYALVLSKSEHIQYTPSEEFKILTTFTSEPLTDSNWQETTAEFISIDRCMTPNDVDVRTSKQASNFIHVTSSTESQLSWRLQRLISDPGVRVRYINFPLTYQNFWGLLKVTSGFVTRSPCDLFGGVKVTRTAFIRPPTHGDFFTNTSTVFLKPKTRFYVLKGEDVDVAIAAVGGSEKDWYGDPEKEYPTVKLYRNRQRVYGDELIDVKRLFQREVIFRFRNVTEEDAGRYIVKAKMQEGRAVHSFNIIVDGVC